MSTEISNSIIDSDFVRMRQYEVKIETILKKHVSAQIRLKRINALLKADKFTSANYLQPISLAATNPTNDLAIIRRHMASLQNSNPKDALAFHPHFAEIQRVASKY